MLSLDAKYTNGLIDTLKQYTNMIEDAEHRRWETSQAIKNIESDISQVEFQFVFEVETETDDKGKKVYANQKLRDIAVAQKMNADDNVTRMREQLQQLQLDKHNADREAFKLRDEVKNLRLEIEHHNSWRTALSDPAIRERVETNVW